MSLPTALSRPRREGPRPVDLYAFLRWRGTFRPASRGWRYQRDIMSFIEQFGGRERTFAPDEILVSKTDTTGRISYCNDVFIRVSGYAEPELLGKPHKILRHPAMPKTIYKIWWDHLKREEEVFAYVVNRSKNGDYYWVSAHGTPSRNASGAVVGFHSNRRAPGRGVIGRTIIPLFQDLLAIEQREGGGRKGMEAAHAHFTSLLARNGLA